MPETLSLRTAIALAAAALATLPAIPVPAQTVAPYTVVETGKAYSRLQDAIDSIGSGAGTIRFASLNFRDCGVQTDGTITYQATVAGQSVLEGVACEGKAALVLRGRGARIDGLVFADIRVPDHNGAGIRLERGELSVSQSWFRDSEQGILTGDDESASIVIDKSTFTRLGDCTSSCAHSVYTGSYGSLTVTNSRFEAGRAGHYLKSRTGQVTIRDNSFDDSHGRTTNYMIDLSAGATGRIEGNWFVQGRDKENYSAFIAVAAEGRGHPSRGLAIAGNDARFAPDVERESAFVADWSGEQLALGSNSLGPGLKRYERR